MSDNTKTTIQSPRDLGRAVRARRRARGLGLREAAPGADVGTRFFSEFERGKPTAELGKVLAVLDSLGLNLRVAPREADPDRAPEGGYSRLLGTEFPYDWSNSRMDADTFIRKVLQSGRYDDLLRTVDHFGFDRVGQEVRALHEPLKSKVADQLARIYRGLLMAQPVDADAS